MLVPVLSTTTSTLSSTGWRGWTSPPKMCSVPSITEAIWDERLRRSLEWIFCQLPLSVLMGIETGMLAVVN